MGEQVTTAGLYAETQARIRIRQRPAQFRAKTSFRVPAVPARAQFQARRQPGMLRQCQARAALQGQP